MSGDHSPVTLTRGALSSQEDNTESLPLRRGVGKGARPYRRSRTRREGACAMGESADVVRSKNEITPRLGPQPEPWKGLTLESAVLSAVGSLFNPDPADPSEPHGPGAPVIRDIMAAIAVLQISSLIEDGPARKTIQVAASSHVAAKAAQLAGP